MPAFATPAATTTSLPHHAETPVIASHFLIARRPVTSSITNDGMEFCKAITVNAQYQIPISSLIVHQNC
jgi:hypothetical protein